MKKIFSFLLLGLLLSIGNAWAADVITFADLGLSNGVQYTDPFDGGNFTVTFGGGGNDGKYYTTGSAIRVYGGGTMTIAAETGKLASITITYDGTNKPTTNDVVSVGTYNNTTGIWTGDAQSVVFTRPSGSGHWRVKSLSVTYAGATPTCATPTFTPAAGTYTSAQNVSIACTTEGSEIHYTTDGADPTEQSAVYSSPIAVTATTTIKAIAVAEGYDNSAIATATYTIELPLSTMDQIFERATAVGTTATNVNITLGNWLVTGVTTNNAYVTDGTKGFLIYEKNHGFQVGDLLSGTVACKVQLYGGSAELTTLSAATQGLTVNTGGVPTIANIEMANLAGINTGALVHYEGLTCSINNNKYYLSDGTTTLQLYNVLYDFDALESGKTYNITGVYVQYNSTKEIMPRSAADIEEVVVPYISVDPTSVNAPVAGKVGTIDITYENLTISDASDFDIQYYDGEDHPITAPSWLVCAVEGTNIYELSYIIDANTGEARTTYLKVYAMDAHSNLVYSDLITISQDAYVPAANYVIVTDAADIMPGAHYIIASGTNGDIKIMGEQRNNNRGVQNVTALDGVIDIPAGADTHEFVICKDGDLFAIYEAGVGYLYAASSSSNNLKSQATNNVNGRWEITIDGEDSVASIIAKESSNRNVMRYNSGSTIFASYASATQSDVYLYRKTGESFTTETVTVSDVGYATLYYGTENLIVPEGVVARTYKVESGALVETKTYEAGEVVPKTIAVVLEGAEGIYDFIVTPVPGMGPAATNLKGSDVATTTTGGDVYYALSLANGSTDPATVGFYWMIDGGAAFTNGAHKAYLALGATQAPARYYVFNEENNATDIQNVEGTENAVKFIENGKLYIQKNGVVYDAMGKTVR